MKAQLIRTLGVIIELIVVLGVASIAAGQPLSNQQITHQIEGRLSKDNSFENVRVFVQEHIVSLTGTVPSLWAMTTAIANARQTAALRSVMSDTLTIESAESDRAIAEQIARDMRRVSIPGPSAAARSGVSTAPGIAESNVPPGRLNRHGINSGFGHGRFGDPFDRSWPHVGRVGKRGGQRQYSDLAIETALTLRLIFHLPLRQTEGFLTSIFGMLGLALSAPDHTTLSRRGQHLDLPLRRAPAGVGLHLLVDSTGLSIVGEGEWAAAKHGGRGRRGWKKRHLGVDRPGVIVARALTEASVDDATTGITLIEAVDGALGRVTADAAYDTVGFYEAAGARRATVVVPPTSTANVSRHGPRSSARDRTILAVKETGRRRWKQMSGYHGQARVENAFFRYTSIIGDGLRGDMPSDSAANTSPASVPNWASHRRHQSSSSRSVSIYWAPKRSISPSFSVTSHGSPVERIPKH